MYEEDIYISSDGTRKDVKSLNTEYLINALAKANREIYNSETKEVYIKYANNIEVLERELDKRRNEFFEKKLDEGWF